ncbi:MAG: reverse transcriptase [Methylobacter sp.]|nr:MAG: reverse transcriptase [Methylobacter sp.]
MAWHNQNFISLQDIYIAYRKAKREAFYDRNCAYGLKFADFEQDLIGNLEYLFVKLNDEGWTQENDFIGSYTYIPKSIESAKSDENDPVHFFASDPLEDWERLHVGKKKAKTEYRLVCDPSVNYMIISALWVLKVGHKYDASLDSRYALGNRLRRLKATDEVPAGKVGPINLQAHTLFNPYFNAYGEWRRRGLQAMKSDLEAGNKIIAITMDLQRFYHQIDPKFLLDTRYLKEVDVFLSDDERALTDQLLMSMNTWREATGDGGLGLPVGLSASSVIANVLLKEFDTHVIDELMPVYYGRYVDDIFLVLRPGRTFSNGHEFLKWMAKRLKKFLILKGDKTSPELELKLPYAGNSILVFVGKKQKIFQLEGKTGIDLLHPIFEQIRSQSSEHSLLPELPKDEARMAMKALLVTPDATLEADALRKADVITIKRGGFALLLSDAEDYARDLEPSSWASKRREFYGLAERHLLTPNGIFDFFQYIPKIIGLAVACNDWNEATAFIDRFSRITNLIAHTSRSSNGEALECWNNIVLRIREAILQSMTEDKNGKELLRLIQHLDDKFPLAYLLSSNEKQLLRNVNQLKLADWSRTPYVQLWTEGLKSDDNFNTTNIEPKEIRRFLRVSTIKLFGRLIHQPSIHWPALIFPTRPIAFCDMTRLLSPSSRTLKHFRNFSIAFRGAWMPPLHGLRIHKEEGSDRNYFAVPDDLRRTVHIAVTNFLTSNQQWVGAVRGCPDLSLERFELLNRVLRQVMKEQPRPCYVVLPECSLPRRWMLPVARKLASRGISLLAGLEYEKTPDGLKNEALLSLTTNFAGYPGHVCFTQSKLAAAWGEDAQIRQHIGQGIIRPKKEFRPIYDHGGFHFGLLLCSDLTNIGNRAYFQGSIDALFVLEWNQDLPTFSSLVESGALDIHAFIIQANNRLYGDSRIRAPFRQEYKRDVVRLKGGEHDYYVIGKIKYMPLRDYQSDKSPNLSEDAVFKPFPIGFQISDRRRIGNK